MTLALLMPTKSKGESIPSIETWRLSVIVSRDANDPEKLIMPVRSLTWSRRGAHTMPPKPTWFHRLPEILEVLRTMKDSYLDRQAVEQLFGVGECRAR